jgi:hypothetical protein
VRGAPFNGEKYEVDSCGVIQAKDRDRSERAHSGPETTHCGSRYDLRESEPAAGREAHMKHVAPHEISGPKSARPHGGIPDRPVLSSEQRRGQWVVTGQEFM